MQHSYPLARAGRRRLADGFWFFDVSWRHCILQFDLHRCSSWNTRLTDCAWREVRHLRLHLDRGLSRRSSDAFSKDVWLHRIDHFDATRWHCFTVVWNDRLTMASPVTVFPARRQRESAETNDVANLIVCYVIDEALIMCDWLHVLVWFPARPNYKSRFGMVPC